MRQALARVLMSGTERLLIALIWAPVQIVKCLLWLHYWAFERIFAKESNPGRKSK